MHKKMEMVLNLKGNMEAGPKMRIGEGFTGSTCTRRMIPYCQWLSARAPLGSPSCLN